MISLMILYKHLVCVSITVKAYIAELHHCVNKYIYFNLYYTSSPYDRV